MAGIAGHHWSTGMDSKRGDDGPWMPRDGLSRSLWREDGNRNRVRCISKIHHGRKRSPGGSPVPWDVTDLVVLIWFMVSVLGGFGCRACPPGCRLPWAAFTRRKGLSLWKALSLKLIFIWRGERKLLNAQHWPIPMTLPFPGCPFFRFGGGSGPDHPLEPSLLTGPANPAPLGDAMRMGPIISP